MYKDNEENDDYDGQRTIFYQKRSLDPSAHMSQKGLSRIACDLNYDLLNQKSDFDLRYWSLQNLLCSQKVPFHPALHPNSQTPFTALQLKQLDPHLWMQFLPNDPFIHPKKYAAETLNQQNMCIKTYIMWF